MKNNLENQIVLVTGASRGIGQAIALELGKQGATIVGTATTEEGAKKITSVFAEQKIAGEGMVLNIADTSSIESMLAQMKEKVGSPSILINNAGITRDNLMLRMKDQEWDDVINTNLTGIFRVTKICLKDMLKARFGRIVTISSVVGTTGNGGQANYAAAKAGVGGFSRSLAQEVASRNITVNVIAPGFIETDMTHSLTDEQKNQFRIPAGRFGQPADIAYACAFLVSPQASYITGQTLHVNGGMHMGT